MFVIDGTASRPHRPRGRSDHPTIWPAVEKVSGPQHRERIRRSCASPKRSSAASTRVALARSLTRSAKAE